MASCHRQKINQIFRKDSRKITGIFSFRCLHDTVKQRVGERGQTVKGMTGVVLAGGQSRRFGSPKAFAKFKGKYFFEIAVETLRTVAEDIYIVSHPSLVDCFRQKTVEKVIMDDERYRGQGPLAGIYTVMKKSEAEWIFVLPCDMPYMRPEVAEKLAKYANEKFDAIICAHFGRIQPLVGMYHRRTFEQIEKLLQAKDNRMKSLLHRCHVRYVTEQDFWENEIVFRNVNKPNEFDDIVT
ncbi:putative molybdenum cofactor guanylyltransferase [Parageobacillus caldoxylosilyticus]|nr:putative molybdenum cofactor guanylyltransferase [Parageobacillus caldoxylosilyticus]